MIDTCPKSIEIFKILNIRYVGLRLHTLTLTLVNPTYVTNLTANLTITYKFVFYTVTPATHIFRVIPVYSVFCSDYEFRFDRKG